VVEDCGLLLVCFGEQMGYELDIVVVHSVSGPQQEKKDLDWQGVCVNGHTIHKLGLGS